MNEPWINNLILLLIAAISAWTAWTTRQTKAVAVESLDVSKKTEINTNSMKDALVKATAEASHAAGVTEERVKGEAKAALVAQGALAGAADAAHK